MSPFLSDWYRDDPFGFVMSVVITVAVVVWPIGFVVVAVKLAIEVMR
jgi:hypothetical protein